MRIAIAVSDLSIGGAERNAVNFAVGLARRGHDITVVAGDGPLARELAQDGIRHVVARARLGRPWELIRQVAAFRRLAASGLDVAHCFMASAAVAARIAAMTGRRFAVVASPPGMTQAPNEPDWITRARLRAISVSPDLILAPSADFREFLHAAGVPSTRIIDLEFNAIPLWRYAADERDVARVRRELDLPPGAPVACAIARLHPVKRVDLFVRAAARVLERVHNAHFVIVGDGPARPELQELARALGIHRATRFAGSRSDIGAVLGASAVAVQTTYGVGGPGLTTVEAFAAARPVVCVDSGDRRAAVGQTEAAIFVPDGDVGALASAIADLLEDPARATELGQRGRTWAAAHFDLERVLDRLEPLYRSVTSAMGTTREKTL